MRIGKWSCSIDLLAYSGLFRVSKERMPLSVALVNIHCCHVIIMPFRLLPHNPFWKTWAVLKTSWNHSQTFQTAEQPPLPSHPMSVHPIPQFQISESRKALVYTYSSLGVTVLCVYLKKNLNCDVSITGSGFFLMRRSTFCFAEARSSFSVSQNCCLFRKKPRSIQ